MPKKPLLLLTTPRSGSTPVFYLLNQFYPEFPEIHEYLCAKELSYFEDEDGIYLPDMVKVTRMNQQEQMVERERRLIFLCNHKQKFNIKIFSGILNEENLPWFQNTFEWYFLERQDLWSQCLSYLLSTATNEWYAKDGLHFRPNSIEANFQDFLVIQSMIIKYLKYKEAHVNPKVIVFEKLLKDGVESTFKKLDLPVMGKNHALHTVRQNPEDKSIFITNIDQVREWYSSSYLQAFWQI